MVALGLVELQATGQRVEDGSGDAAQVAALHLGVVLHLTPASMAAALTGATYDIDGGQQLA